MGAPGYMSPEQVLDGQADERSDIIAFGILSVERGAHRLFHGSRPFGRLPSGASSSHADRVPVFHRGPLTLPDEGQARAVQNQMGGFTGRDRSKRERHPLPPPTGVV